MNIHLLRANSGYTTPSQSFILDACQELGITVQMHTPQDFDFTEPPPIQPGDASYRTATISHSGIQQLQDFFAPQTVTFITDYELYTARQQNSVLYHQRAGVPLAKTIPLITNHPDLVEKMAEEVGGFPLIVKVLGGSKGVGVIKIESLDSLLSFLDLELTRKSQMIVRQFIHIPSPAYSYRSIILGNEVLYSYKNQSVSTTDFRSNQDQGQRQRSTFELPEQHHSDLIKAVTSLSLELGAVDYVIDDNDVLHIFEVNYPFNFAPVVEDLQFPVHFHMMRYLQTKAHQASE